MEHILGWTYKLHLPKTWSSYHWRNLWVRTIYGTYEIVDDEAKSISYYNGEHLFLAYENFVNDEGRIHLIKTNDGVNWTNINDDELTLPLSESNDETLIYNSGKFVTLTDITFDDDLKILFVESDTENSDDGNISIKEWYNNNTLKITDTNHNQNSAAYFNGNIVTIQDGEAGIPGGDIVIYEKYVEKFRDDSTNCNYFRKAINSTEKSVVSCSPTSLNESSSHYIVNGDH